MRESTKAQEETSNEKERKRETSPLFVPRHNVYHGYNHTFSLYTNETCLTCLQCNNVKRTKRLLLKQQVNKANENKENKVNVKQGHTNTHRNVWRSNMKLLLPFLTKKEETLIHTNIYSQQWQGSLNN